MIKTISYLGLGTMGGGMASNLVKASYKLSGIAALKNVNRSPGTAPAPPILPRTPSAMLS
jgi:3-hydroxyisobutyrate dehydrogenase-like beta-hydroxyacid dehydrogenase